ncbi:ATP-dependent RNA helicase DHX30-like [Anneissia japonica]|uniref:ATP-dependent RNA helicase DHX30-like n=1 Tax=Anneissia japonica TaxID=1529436 RepID=UPI00142577A3|nr:ATP-dependent RNA helicase DHX30-like [Anneissia japonica]
MSAHIAWKYGSQYFRKFHERSRFGLNLTDFSFLSSCRIHSNNRNGNSSTIEPKLRSKFGSGVASPTTTFNNNSEEGGSFSLKDARQALKEFERPKEILNNVLMHGASKVKSLWQYKTTGSKLKRSVLTVNWPVQFEIVTSARKKVEAERMAAALACAKLKNLGYLDKHNRPRIPGKLLLYNKDDIKSFFKADLQPSWISLTPKLKNEVLQGLDNLKHFNSNPGQQDLVAGGFLDSFSEESKSPVIDAITGQPLVHLSDQNIAVKNHKLLDQLNVLENSQSILRKEAASLPIANMREEVISKIRNNQVVVLSGETGCGKTTQVPQFILEDFIRNEKGSECNIIVTQPRRISAISVAQRVANERQENVGKSIGYQVRLNSRLPDSNGSILFCTTGILLKKLQTNSSLTGISHVIIDEVHERDVDTDFLLILVKNLIKENPNIHVILMSASINSKMFSDYFQNCPIISVPGFTYPVTEFFLPEIQQMIGRSLQRTINGNDDNKIRYPFTDFDFVTNLINHLDDTKQEGAILCFLPGWQEIKNVFDQLTDNHYQDRRNRLVLPLHSNFSIAEQQEIFKRPAEGVRKIVLATNIAETSITINDVVYVINIGNHKEQGYNSDLGVSCLDLQWISQANVRQRKGRAGRCQPGECYHLFTQDEYQQLDAYQVPELLRVPLEQVIVHAKVHNPLVNAEEFLSQALQAPTIEAVDKSIEVLTEMDILDKNECLTPLGKKVSQLSTDPRLAKALVYSSIFRCMNPVMTIVAGLSAREPTRETLHNRNKIMAVKQWYGGSSKSDHISRLNIYNAWDQSSTEGSWAMNTFINENCLDRGALYFIKGLRRQFSENLRDAGLKRRCANQEGLNVELIKAVLCGAFVPNILQVRRGLRVRGKLKPNKLSFKDWQVGKVLLRGRSINSKEKSYSSRWLTYFAKTQSSATFIHETSMVHQLGLICLAGKEAWIERLPSALEENLRESLGCFEEDREEYDLVRFRIAITDEHAKSISFFMFEDVAEILLEVIEHVQSLIRESLETNLSQLPEDIEEKHKCIVDIVCKLLSSIQQPYIQTKGGEQQARQPDSDSDVTDSEEMLW